MSAYLPAPGTNTTSRGTRFTVPNDGFQYLPPASSWQSLDTREAFSFSDAQTLNQAAENSEPTSFSIAGYNSAKSIIYGTREITVPFIDVLPYQGGLVFVCGIGMGELDGYVSWTINDEPPAGGAQLINFYRGTQTQGVDPYLANAYAANGLQWTSACRGDAYAIVFVPDNGTYSGKPTIRFVVRGLKVFDPTDPTQVVTNPSTWKFNNVPAVCLADFLTSSWARYTGLAPRHGRYKRVNIASLSNAIAANVRLIGVAPNQERDRQIDLELQRADTDQVVEEALRTYADVYLDVLGAEVFLIPNLPSVSVKSYGDREVEKALYWRLRGTQDVPNWIELFYTTTTGKTWGEQPAPPAIHPSIYSGAFRRAQQVRQPGITRLSQGTRDGIRRLNTLQLSDSELGLVVFDEGFRLRRGDVIDVTLKLGLIAKLFVVAKTRSLGYGRHEIHLIEFDNAMFNDTVVLNPTYSDLGQLDCQVMPAIQNLQVVAVGECLPGVGCANVLRATWDYPAYPCLRHFQVQLRQNGVLIFDGALNQLEYVYSPLSTGSTYQLAVRPVSQIESQNPVAFLSASVTPSPPVCVPPTPLNALFQGVAAFVAPTPAAPQLQSLTGTLSWDRQPACQVDCWEVETIYATGPSTTSACLTANLSVNWTGAHAARPVEFRIRPKTGVTYGQPISVQFPSAVTPKAGRCFTQPWSQVFAAGSIFVGATSAATMTWTDTADYSVVLTYPTAGSVSSYFDPTQPGHAVTLETFSAQGLRISAYARWEAHEQNQGQVCP